MASYLKRCTSYLVPGAAFAAGVIYKSTSEDRNNLSARSSQNSAANQAHATNTPHKWDFNWDRRNPSVMLEERGIKDSDNIYDIELEKCRPKATRNLLLIRHGQYNISGLKDSERTLTPLGRIQAEHTGNRLKELNFPYKALHKSTMTRAQETADIILDCFKENPIEKVRDCNLLEEGAPVPPDPPVRHWKPEVYQFFQDGPRIEAAFRKYFHRADASQTEDSYEVIVCHSNVIRYFVCRALQLPPDAWLRFSINHCSITWLSITPSGRVAVRCVGDSGHMPVEVMTSS